MVFEPLDWSIDVSVVATYMMALCAVVVVGCIILTFLDEP